MPPFVAKIVLYVVLALAGTGLVAGGYYAWKKTIERAAQAELVSRQLQQAVEDAQKANDELRAIQTELNKIREELAQQVEDLERNAKAIEDSIDAHEDRESSDVIKDTVKQLGGGQ